MAERPVFEGRPQAIEVVLGVVVVAVELECPGKSAERVIRAPHRLIGDPQIVLNVGRVRHQIRGALEGRDSGLGVPCGERIAAIGVERRTRPAGTTRGSKKSADGSNPYKAEPVAKRNSHPGSFPGAALARKAQSYPRNDFAKETVLKQLAHILSICSALAVAGSAAAAEEPGAQITVSGSGRVSAPPDTAYIQTGVGTEAKVASDAIEQNSRAMAKVLQALANAKIAERDIQTQHLDLSPIYSSQRGSLPKGSSRNTITGYRASNRVRVRVRDLSKVGAVLDAVVGAGANDLGGISFAVAEPEPLLDRALKLAMADAKRKATLLSAEAGVRLGRVLEIRDGSAPAPSPMARGRVASFEAVAVPVAAGELEFSARVSATYALGGAAP